MAYFLGVDLGTTLVTALVVDERGLVHGRQSVPLELHLPAPGRVEQDPWALVEAVRAVVGPLLREFAIEAMGLDNQGESFGVWDRATGQPLTPSIVWQDQRGAEVCARLAARVSDDVVRQRTGLLLDSYFSAPKLAQVLDGQPGLRERAARGEVLFGTTETWVLWTLTRGEVHVTDATTASRTLLFNLHTLGWDEDMLALFDVPRAMLPRVVPSAGDVVTLQVGTAVPLRALLVDQQAALFGQGCVRAGDARCTLGTGCFLLANVGPRPVLSTHGLLTTVAWQVPGEVAYALDGGIFAAGAAVRWLAEGLKLIPDPAASDGSARRAQDDDVVVVPAIHGRGAPRWMTGARGAVFGLSGRSTADDVTRATLLGIAAQVREVLVAMEQDTGRKFAPLRVDGGPTANAFLVQALADLLDVEVQVAADREATAMGAALMAAVASGALGFQDVAGLWRASATCRPAMDPARRERYLRRWERAVDALRVFHVP